MAFSVELLGENGPRDIGSVLTHVLIATAFKLMRSWSYYMNEQTYYVLLGGYNYLYMPLPK